MDFLLTDRVIQGGAISLALVALSLVGLLARNLYLIVTNHQVHDLEERKALRKTLDHGNEVHTEQTRVLQELVGVIHELREK